MWISIDYFDYSRETYDEFLIGTNNNRSNFNGGQMRIFVTHHFWKFVGKNFQKSCRIMSARYLGPQLWKEHTRMTIFFPF